MRVTTLQRADIGIGGKRLDPSFYLQGRGILKLIEDEDYRNVPLGDLLSEMHDGARIPIQDEGIPMLRISNIKACEIDFQNIVHVAYNNSNSWPKVQPEDVLFTRSAVPFRAAVAPHDSPTPMTVSQEITVLRPQPAILPEFLAAILSTESFTSVCRDLSYRGGPSALRRLRLRDISRLPIPLPPRSIQEEIKRSYLKASELTAQARKELSQIINVVNSEIDARLDLPNLPDNKFYIQRTSLKQRFDVPYAKSRLIGDALYNNKVMRPLLNLALSIPSSLKGIDEEEEVLAVNADTINEKTFLVENARPFPLADLSPRMRQPLSTGDVLICTTGSGQQIAYLDEVLGNSGMRILGSATFTTLRFKETPRYFAIALSHPIVRMQLELLSTGAAQRFVSKRDLDDLLVPCLSIVWREDFDTRVERAMQRRREALEAKAYLLEIAEAFVKERWNT